MKRSELVELWERTRQAWADGELSTLNAKPSEVARRDMTIDQFIDDTPKLVQALDTLQPRRTEWIYGYSSGSYDTLLTNERLMVRNKDTGMYDVYELVDIATYKEAGWWTKSVTISLRDGTKRIYKGLGSSIRPEYLLLALSRVRRENDADEPESETTQPLTGSAPAPPPPYTGGEGFIFISYKREDMPQVAPHLVYLVQNGYKIWYDKGIPGGAEWDAMVEQKLSDCQLLLVFLSQAAADSKWVRREIKYADAKNKPILTLALGEVQLRHGLEIVLRQYQILADSSPDISEELLRAIEYVKRL